MFSFTAVFIIVEDCFVMTEFSAFSISSTSLISKLNVVLAFVMARSSATILKYKIYVKKSLKTLKVNKYNGIL